MISGSHKLTGTFGLTFHSASNCVQMAKQTYDPIKYMLTAKTSLGTRRKIKTQST